MRKTVLLLLVALAFLGSSIAKAHEEFKVLVFSKTAEFRHTSIPDGLALVQSLAATNHFTADATEDASAFTETNLSQYAAVIFMMTTGDVLDTNQQAAFENYIRSGGGWVGVHSATDTERLWPWYGQLIGAWQTNHPNGTASATVKVTDRVHPSTRDLPERWVRTDEWYNFKTNPAGSVHVLAWLDETSASNYFASAPAAMGFDHPIAWCHEFDGGRAWYTALGHTSSGYSEPPFVQHLLGGILWAANESAGDAGSTIWTNFEKTVLDSNALVEPLALDVAPDGRVFYVERVGRLNIFLPANSTRVQIPISVNSATSDGLIGVALDPGFTTNQWIYLVYGPASTEVLRLSRFTMISNSLDFASEKILLTIPIESVIANHISGDLEFGPDGCLYWSVGDNSRFNGSPNNGYAPIDERPGQSQGDAQRSAANTMDLRGKILRIKPETNGTYSIPSGNLYPVGTPQTRPEIYVMGCRNPFRIAVDQSTGWLYWGEVGPDATSDSATRGPRGYDEWNQARTPGYYGWPYGIANNKPYIDYDFAAGTNNGSFNLTNVINLSPNNTGLTNLPAARPAWIWYPYGTSVEFPEVEISSDRCAFVGSYYHFNATNPALGKLPAYYDNTLFVIEFSRNYIKEIKIDTNGNVLKINKFLPGLTLNSPIDMKTGPDGALYLIEYGTGWRADNVGGKLSRIVYTAGNKSPVAAATGTPSDGPTPLFVQFSGAGSSDPEGQDITYAWDFELDGVIDSTNVSPTHTYSVASNYIARLTVTDPFGATGISDVFVSAGNTRPSVTIQYPPNGSFMDWGDFVRFNVMVNDAEDGSTTNGAIDCADVDVETALGHDEHAHAVDQLSGCQGVFQVASDHTGTENIFFLMSATYTDQGASGVNPLSGGSTVHLNPKRLEAEHFKLGSGITDQNTSDTSGVRDVVNIDHGDYIAFTPINLTNITTVTFRAAATGAGGNIALRVNGTNGTLIGSAVIPPTAGAYANVTIPVTDPGFTHDLYLVFTRNPGDTNLFSLNWVEFQGAGAGVPLTPYSGSPAVIPGILQAENFDLGGSDIASHDTTPGNSGGQYRSDTDTDIEVCADAGGGFNLTNVRSNEWLRYTITAADAGLYTFNIRVASTGAGGTFLIEFDGEDATGPISIPNTGGSQSWQTVTVTNVLLLPGQQVMRVLMLTDGPGGAVGNFNYFSVTLPATNQPPTVALTNPPSGSSFAAPALISLTATAADSDGGIALVEFYANGTNKVGQATTAPFTASWSNVVAGAYALTARAVDNLGLARTSTVVNVTVTNIPWFDLDFTGSLPAGSFSISTNGVYSVSGGGVDIWATADTGHFVHRTVTGNAEIIARVITVGNTQPFAKGGVMIRESLNANARNCYMAMTRDNGPTFQWRTNTGGSSFSYRPVVLPVPLWVRLVRVGNVFTSYRSTDGSNWTFHEDITNVMTSSVFIGLAVTSHTNGIMSTSTFDNVAIYTAPTIVAQPAGQVANPGTSALLSVLADSTSLRYQWRRDGLAIAAATNASFSIPSVQNSNTGAYTVVVSNYLGSVTSVVAQITMNVAPTVSLTNPANGSAYARPLNLSLAATATDSDGSVARVDFYRGAIWLGATTNSPHAIIWSNPPAGLHLLSAAATDNLGLSNFSAVISVSLTNPPPVIASPTGGFWSNGQFRLTMQGIAGDSLRIEASTNLRDWATIATNVLNGGLQNFSDPGATNYPQRFYRGTYVP